MTHDANDLVEPMHQGMDLRERRLLADLEASGRLGTPVEATVFDPLNPHVLRGHLYCAAVEMPLSDADLTAWGAERVAAGMAADGWLRPCSRRRT